VFTRYLICGQGLTVFADKCYAYTVQFPWKWISTRLDESQSFDNEQWTYFYENGYFYYSTIHQRIVGWLITTYFAVYLSLFLTNVMFIDLFMVIRAPFKAQGPRLKMLTHLSFFLAFIFAMANYLILKAEDEKSEHYNMLFFYTICAGNVAISLVCVFWIGIRFKNETTNREFKIAIGRRYIEFFLTFCFLELPFLIFTRPYYGWDTEECDG
jgi:hypothetical protein